MKSRPDDAIRDPVAVPSRKSASFPIVGIGASAGGLEALTEFFHTLPTPSGMAFGVVQHLDPHHDSALADLLAKTTSMPVTQAQDGIPVQPDHVYVVPPNTTMSLVGNTLHLSPREPIHGMYMPIDHFFRSLAEQHLSQAIGIILSGTGSDGAIGLDAIKENGGVTFVQDEKTAKFAGMPHSAISTGSADFVLPIEAMTRELSQLSGRPYLTAPTGTLDEAPRSEGVDSLATIFRLLRQTTGVDFSAYKRNTIVRRITRRMMLRKQDHLEDYGLLLKKDGDELEALYHDLLIKVTTFFRDADVFSALKTSIIPAILKRHESGRPIRVWVAGCSTGEEVYSIAMSFLECMGDHPTHLIQLFATDIDELALQKARSGLYIENIAMDISAERLRRFFQKVDHNYRINKAIREMCVFARHDLAKDPPFSGIDLLSCRNVMIYLEPALQKRILPIFNYSLTPNGVLLLGNSETIGTFSDFFTIEDKKNKIYQRKVVQARTLVDFAPRTKSMDDTQSHSPIEPPVKEFDLYREADRVLLNHYGPAGILVNENLDILQFRGDTSRFLMPAPGKASLNLLRMARDGLLVEIKATLDRSKATGAPTQAENIRLRYDNQWLRVTVKVIPLRLPPPAHHFVVLFEESPVSTKPLVSKKSPSKSSGRDETMEQENGRLKQELDATKQYLQSIIERQDVANEELKSANEEVLSSNEELQSSNEELETAKEELQSTNEELSTVNEEVRHRNSELSQVNNDLNNLFSSTNLPIVMLAHDLRIRRLTEKAMKALNILPTDMGRPIGDLKLNIIVPDLDALLATVIDTVTVHEQEVQDRAGRWYSMQIRPYKTSENKIDGAVLFFLDIDVLKRNTEELVLGIKELHIARDYSEGIVQTVREPLLVLDSKLHVISANPAFYRLFEVSKQETEGQSIFVLGQGQWGVPGLRARLERALTEDFEDVEVTSDLPGLGSRVFLMSGRRIQLDGSGTETLLIAIEDITERRASEKQLISLKEKEVLLKEIHHRVKNNLQIISSLLQLQSRSIQDPRVLTSIQESQDRIEAIALVHEKLYRSNDLSQIDIEDYIKGLVGQLLRSIAVSESIEVKIHADHLLMDVDTAIPCGLILNELVSNAFKHAFKNGKSGCVTIDLHGVGDQGTLKVTDNGVGLPLDLTISEARSLGLRLVQDLVEQLHGRLTVGRSSSGTDIEIQFPLKR